ncbi:MAG: GumJ protein [Herminiimonas sp.]|nr:GumJ protein [Herminiimonas sp.]
MKVGEGKIPHITLPRLGWQALKWNYFGNAARGLSQFLIGILLARLLGPEPFGIVAIAWMILGIGNLFADLGFGAALIQRENFSKLDLRFIFTCQMTFATVLTLSGLLSGQYIAAYFHRPDATPVIQAMFFLFMFQSFGQTAAAILRRSLNFKALQKITITSYLIGYLFVGVPAAYFGFGVWSLVAAQLVQSLLNSFQLIRITKVPITPYFRGDSAGIVKFGLKITAANISSWSISNLDTVFIGRAFGVLDLGLYSRAMNLLTTPMTIITTGFQGVLFSACSRTQNDLEKVKRIYLETNAVIAIICFPIFIAAAVIPETLILGIYGPKWQASAGVVTPLALAILVNALLAIKGPILMAGNRVGVELKNQIYTILLFVPILSIAIHYSLQAVAWSVFGIYLIRWSLLTIATLRFTGATVGEFARTFYIPAMLACAISAATAAADHYFSSLPAFYRLAAAGGAAFMTLLVFMRLFGGHFLKANLGTLIDVNNLSGVLRKLLNV